MAMPCRENLQEFEEFRYIPIVSTRVGDCDAFLMDIRETNQRRKLIKTRQLLIRQQSDCLVCNASLLPFTPIYASFIGLIEAGRQLYMKNHAHSRT
jgi:hypothetical protein